MTTRTEWTGTELLGGLAEQVGGTQRKSRSWPNAPRALAGRLAVALHESATNAVKYGALSEPNGAIRITWQTLGEAFRLEWHEVGGPAIVSPEARGFGSVLTERSISQLGGKIG